MPNPAGSGVIQTLGCRDNVGACRDISLPGWSLGADLRWATFTFGTREYRIKHD